MRKEVADGHNSTIKMVCQQIAIHMHIRAEDTNARFEPLWFVWSLVAAILVAAAAACMHVCLRLCVSVCSLSFYSLPTTPFVRVWLACVYTHIVRLHGGL